ncbi:MAG: 30S ribosomal protein S3 [bacterium]|nr:30S ribosomal protein S3 [bacterium]
MGQKVKPIGLRLGINRTWDSRWFADKKDYARLLLEDLKIRDHVMKALAQAGISRVIVERPAKKPCITIYASRPGLIIGKKGADIEKLKKDLSRMTGVQNISLNIIEIRKPEVDARLIAENIAQQISRRLSYRRAMKRAIQQAMRMGAEGIRVKCAGRLAGAEIARSEEYREGRVPLHTLRADVDYAEVPAHTTYGVTGVKVWVFKGEIMEHNPMAHEQRLIDQQAMR